MSSLFFSLKSFKNFAFQELPKAKTVLEIIRKNKIDIVHSHHNLRSAKLELLAARLSGAKCVLHHHGYANYCGFDLLFDRLCHRHIYISSDVARYHQARGESPEKGIVVHNGIHTDDFLSSGDGRLIKTQQFGFSREDTVIGLIGRIDWWKGQDVFIKAISEVIKEKPNVKAVIIGSVDNDKYRVRNLHYFQSIQALVSECGLDGKVLFMGHREDIPHLIGGLDIVVHASTTPEPFGLVIIEAMAASKPVIATAAGGVLDIITDGLNGKLVPCNNHKAMSEAILNLIAAPGKAKKMAEAAHAAVIDRFTIRHQVDSIETLYDSIS